MSAGAESYGSAAFVAMSLLAEMRRRRCCSGLWTSRTRAHRECPFPALGWCGTCSSCNSCSSCHERSLHAAAAKLLQPCRTDLSHTQHCKASGECPYLALWGGPRSTPRTISHAVQAAKAFFNHAGLDLSHTWHCKASENASLPTLGGANPALHAVAATNDLARRKPQFSNNAGLIRRIQYCKASGECPYLALGRCEPCRSCRSCHERPLHVASRTCLQHLGGVIPQ
jgi:hypothetical protein